MGCCLSRYYDLMIVLKENKAIVKKKGQQVKV